MQRLKPAYPIERIQPQQKYKHMHIAKKKKIKARAYASYIAIIVLGLVNEYECVCGTLTGLLPENS